MNSLCLTEDELKELTGRVQHSAQHRALQAMGIPSKIRPDGSVAVLYQDVLGNKHVRPDEQSPDLGALDVA